MRVLYSYEVKRCQVLFNMMKLIIHLLYNLVFLDLKCMEKSQEYVMI